jgi:hypothetical protein
MAKRARGTTTRPGQRRPLQRPANRPASAAGRPANTASPAAASVRPASLTPEEEARAAQLEAAIVAEERQAEDARRNRQQRASAEPVARAGSPLAVIARDEYAYVARDVRRVTIVGGSLIGILVALWVVTQVTGITL